MRHDKPTTVLWMSEDDEKIRMHLVSWCRKGILTLKSFGRIDIPPGANVDERRRELVRTSEILLAPITAKLLADNSMHLLHLEACDRHREGSAQLVPVLLQQVSLKNSLFKDPDLDLEPIVSEGVWLDVTPAHVSETRWSRVPEGVERAIEGLWHRRLELTPNVEYQQSSTTGHGLASEPWQEPMVNNPNAPRPDGSMPPRRRILRENDLFGAHYRLRARIGIDALSTIWRAIDTRSGKIVTIRVLHDAIAGDWNRRSRISLRTHALWNIHHPALISVLEPLTEMNGFYFYVTQFFEGTPLRREALRRPMDEVAVLSLLLHLGRALELVHARGIAHGDIRPANLLSDGESPPKLSDFPLLWGEEGRTRGASVAYEASLYTAPELNQTGASPTPESDVYSLARTAIFCLRGSELPEDSDGEPEPLYTSLPCAEGVKEVLERAAHSDLAMRYHRGSELCDALLRMYRADPRKFLSMVDLEGGDFRMGDDASKLISDKPEHLVTVSPLSIGRYPVTQRQYRQIMLCNPSYTVGEELPVNRVSFYDALEFCNRLSALEGHTEAYTIRGDEVIWNPDADGYRLPTEAEWEYAARGPGGRRYPWGEEEPSNQLCWSGPGNDAGPQGRRGPSPVGKYAESATPGADGIMDLAGNVWEWCWDWHALYDSSARHEIDPRGPDAPSDPALRALRGAAWNEQSPDNIRAAVRSREEPSARDPDIGFRVVRSRRPAKS